VFIRIKFIISIVINIKKMFSIFDGGFMVTVSKRINVLFLAMAIAFMPVYADNTTTYSEEVTQEYEDFQELNELEDQKADVWYKKHSRYIIAAAVTTVVLYALAVHKNKITGSGALLAALFFAEKKIDDNKNNKQNTDSQGSNPVTNSTNKTIEPKTSGTEITLNHDRVKASINSSINGYDDIE